MEKSSQKTAEDINEIINISILPKKPSWRPSQYLYKYQGFWGFPNILKGVILFQKNFKPQPNDILICSLPKSGTTWLKSLSVAISTRSKIPDTDLSSSTNSLITTTLPRDIVPFLEFLYIQGHSRDPENPLVSTHVPFASFPESILNSDTKIIYVCRNPKDVFVSLWHFTASKKSDGERKVTFEEAYEQYCDGVSGYAPYWDHVLGYWKASLEFPDRVLFLKYEDMKNDTRGLYVKKMADFMSCPFSVDEEKLGAPEKIVKLCSFESLSSLEVNKSANKSNQMPLIIEKQ